MPWRETSRGRFERPFNSLEKMYRTISAAGAAMKREHFAISAVVRLHLGSSIADAENALRHAWKTLRYDFPHIAAYGQGDTFVYEVPGVSALESWLADTFVVELAASSTNANLYSEASPTEFARIHYFPHTSEILLHSSHWRIDGIGALHLLNHFLKVLAYPRAIKFGDEGKNLLIGLDEVVNIASEVTPQMEQAATDLVMKFVNNLPSIGLPTSSEQVPRGSGRCAIKIDKQLTSAIIARCKTHGFSVTTATHAAIVYATSQYSDPHRPTGKYTSWSTFDLRKYCPHPYNGATNPVSIFHTGIPVAIDASDFLGNAEQFRRIYAQNLTAPGPRNMFSFLPCYVDKVCAVLTQPPPPEALPPTEPSLSSLGVIDRYLDSTHGDVEVTDFWLGVEMLTRQLMVYVWTRQGEMELSACYNKAFYTHEFVEEFLSRVQHILFEGLKI